MTEEAFLRYRMIVVQLMPDSSSKRALMVAIQTRMATLACARRLTTLTPRSQNETSY